MTTDLQEVKAEPFTINEGLLRQVDQLADMMAGSGTAVPEHLRGKKGTCFAVVMQAFRWEMDPFSVAARSFIAKNGRLDYDGQLISAVVIARAPTRARPAYEFIGDWSKVLGKFEERKSDKGEGKYAVATYTKADEEGLGVIVSATFRDEREPRAVQVMLSQAYPRFSTQWANDPQQQICLLAIRKWARRHTPDVLLGVPEEQEPVSNGVRDMGTVDEVPRTSIPAAAAATSRTASMKERLKKHATQQAAPNLDEVLKAIADATSADELSAAGTLATRLHSEQEKEIARTAYADRLNAARAEAHAAKASTPDEMVMPYAEVMDAIEKADGLDTLDLAADLIRHVPSEGQRDELEERYVARRKQFEGTP